MGRLTLRRLRAGERGAGERPTWNLFWLTPPAQFTPERADPESQAPHLESFRRQIIGLAEMPRTEPTL